MVVSIGNKHININELKNNKEKQQLGFGEIK
jgi:hypothetical protein